MKKKAYDRAFNLQERLKKKFILFICTLFWFTMGISNVFGEIKMDRDSVVFKDNQMTVEAAFDVITKQLKYDVFYSESELDVHQMIQVPRLKMGLAELLNFILKTEFTYEIKNRTIIISPKRKENSEQREIRGIVKDEDQLPLPGVTILVKGTTIGLSTNAKGEFHFPAPSNVKDLRLLFSFVGMETQEVEVKSDFLSITMKMSMNQMDEVIVRTGFENIDKRKLTSSVVTVKMDDIMEPITTTLDKMLQGKIPGMAVLQQSSTVGAAPKIRIRGSSTIVGSREPLWVLDGIVLEDPVPLSPEELNSMDQVNLIGNAISGINPEDIEQIDVLKDASATAVYGVKGANGVILVTTKRGNEGRAKIDVSMNMTAKVVSALPGRMESADALYVRNQAAEYELGLNPASWNKILPMETIDKYRHPANLEEAERYPNVDWQKELFKDYAMSYNPSINLSGGTRHVKYFAAVDFLHEGDLFREWDNNRGYQAGYGFNRINARSNLDFKITKTTVLKANIFGSYGVKKSPWGVADDSFGASQLWQAAYSSPSDAFLPRYSDGTWGYYKPNSQGAPNSVLNLANAGYEMLTTTRVNTDFVLEQDLSFLVKGLRASAMISWDNVFVEAGRGVNDLNHGTQTKWIDPETGEVHYSNAQTDSKTGLDFQEGILWSTAGGAVRDWSTQRNLFYQGQLSWSGKFGDHDVSAMGVFNRTERSTGSEFPHYREDWAFRATYSYGNRYFLEYNGAYNGSEKFSPDYRFELFNSGALGWMISEERFFKPLRKWVDMLKVRYSIGEVGDDNLGIRFLYATQWAYGGKSFHGLNNRTESPYTWYKEATVGNPDVHWETALKQNIGVDYAFFDGLLAGSLEFFYDKRSDILVAGDKRATPGYLGISAPAANLGRVRTKGYELELRVNKTLNNGLRLWGNFNMTHAENKILKYDDPVLRPAYQKSEGFAIGQDHAHLTAGFANTWDEVFAMPTHNTMNDQKLPGQYITMDYNGDGVIDANDSAPYGYTGTPENTYNATIGFDYKGFSCFVQFYGVTNVNRYVGFTSLHNNVNTVFDEGVFWSKDRFDADAPMPRINSTPSYYEGTRFHYDGSFIRLKNAEVAYTFTQPWVKKIGLNRFKIFLNGNNLWVWSRMPDDRESNFAGTGLASQGAYPTVRRFNLGIKFDL